MDIKILIKTIPAVLFSRGAYQGVRNLKIRNGATGNRLNYAFKISKNFPRRKKQSLLLPLQALK